MDIREALKTFLMNRFGDSILREDVFRDQQFFFIKPESLLEICHALMDDAELEVKLLADITCVDWLSHETEMGGRFEVVYNFYSLKHSYRFFIKVMLPSENPEVASLTPLWNGANWLEREVWDLFGVKFTGHPDLTKILTPDELEGHPLRKDYPLTYEIPQFTFNKDEPPEVIR